MGTIQRKIEVDEATAAALEHRASEQGLSVSQLVAELAQAVSEPVVLPAEDIAGLDRRWQDADAGAVVSHAEVVRWLQTWGTSAFKPWRSSR